MLCFQNRLISVDSWVLLFLNNQFFILSSFKRNDWKCEQHGKVFFFFVFILSILIGFLWTGFLPLIWTADDVALQGKPKIGENLSVESQLVYLNSNFGTYSHFIWWWKNEKWNFMFFCLPDRVTYVNWLVILIETE